MSSSNWIVLFVVLAVVIWAYRYRQVGAQLPRARWLTLILLRVAAVGMIVWLLSGPTRQETMQQEEHVYFPILVDDSRSMQLAGGEGGTRGAEAASLVFGATGLSKQLEAAGWQAPVLRLSDLAPMAADEAFDPRAPQTHIAQALARAAEIWKPEELAGVALVSDGRDHGEPSLRAAQALGRPLLTVGVGPESLPLDLAVEPLSMPRRVYANETFTCTLRATRQGPVGDVVDATLTITRPSSPPSISGEGGIEGATPVVQSMQLQFAAGQAATEKQLQLRLPMPGAHAVSVELAVQPGERVVGNNRTSRDVQVEKAKLRVLLVAQSLDWEVGFIRRYLGGDPRVELATLLPVFPEAPSIDREAAPESASGETRLLFGEEEIESPTYSRMTMTPQAALARLSRYDVFLLYRPGAMIDSELAARLREQVEKGATLLVLGLERGQPQGVRSLGALLPAAFSTQPPLPFPLSVRPASGVEDLPVSDMLHSIPWAKLPPLTDVFLVDHLQPAARVLLVGEAQGVPPQPLLMVQRFGLGQVLLSAMAHSWRWQMYSDPDQTQGPGPLEAFWLSLLHFTAQDPGGFESRLEIPRSVVQRGEPVEIRLFRDVGRAERQPPESVLLRVTGPSGGEETLSAALVRRNLGLYQTTYTPTERGGYRVLYQEADQSVERSFSAVEEGNEDADYTMDPALLSRLAESTGGVFATPGSLGAAVGHFQFQPRSTTTVVSVFLGRSLWILAIVIGLFCLEWLLRRVAQLP